MNNRGSGAKSEGFFTGKGFYIVLFLCAAVIGVSAWMMAAGSKTMEDSSITPSTRRVETVIIPALDDELEPAMTVDNPIKLTPPAVDTEGIAEIEELPAAVPASSTMYVWPVVGEIERGHSTETLSYDVTMRDWRTHSGIDIAAPLGTTVNAAHAGSVESIETDDLFGTVVTVAHGDGIRTVYANLAASPAVAVGDWVEPGDTLGSVGTTALCEIGQGTHLHFAVTADGIDTDPLHYLPA